MPPPPPPAARVWRLNVKSLVALAVIVVVGLSAGGFAWYLQNARGQATLVKKARELAKDGKDDLALSFVDRYLKDSPRDLDALSLKGEILSRSARTSDHLDEVIKLSVTMLRFEPDSKEKEAVERRQTTTRRLVEAYMAKSRMVAASERKLEPAEKLAAQLVAEAPTAQHHRLHGQTLEDLARTSVGPIQRNFATRAAKEYETARSLDPTDVDGAVMAARLYHSLIGDTPKAVAVVQALVDGNPSAKALLAAAKVNSSIATDQTSEGKLDEARASQKRAEEFLKKGVAADPKDLQIRLTAAEVALGNKRPNEAARHLENVQEEDRKDYRYRTLLGMVSLYENKTADAIENWKRGLIATEGNDADLSWRLAYVLLQLGRVDEAEELIAQYRRNYGGLETPSAAHYLEALKLLKLNQPLAAAAELEKGRSKVNDALKAQYFYMMGQAREAIRDDAQAMADYSTAIAADPKLTAPRLARIRLMQVASPDEAYAELQKGLTETGDDPQMLAVLAQMELRRQKALPEARRNWAELERILKLGRDAAPALAALAVVTAEALTAQGRTDEARDLLKRATSIDKTDPDLWATRAEGLATEGKLPEAIEVLDQAEAIKGVGDQARFRVLRARILAAQGRGREAREGLTRDEDRVRPDQRPVLWETLGQLYTAQGDLESARKAYAKWAKLLPDDPMARLVVLELAINDTSVEAEAAVKESLKILKEIGGLYSRVGEALVLLRERDVTKTEAPAERELRLQESDRLVKRIEADAPQLRFGPLLRGLLSEQQGDKEKAAAAFERALKTAGGMVALPRLISLYSGMKGRDADLNRLRQTYGGAAPGLDRLTAELYAKGGDKEKAEALARQIVEGDADSLDARVWQARILSNLGKPEEAEKTLRDLIKQNPENVGPWLALMYFQISRKDKPAAVKTVQSMIASAKGVERPDLYWGQAWRAVGEAKLADEAFEAALKAWPDDPRVTRAVSEYYASTGRSQKAEQTLRDVVKRDPSQRWASRGLALILSARLGDRASWQAAWELVKDAPVSGDLPEDRLIRAIVLARGPVEANRQESVKMLELLVDDLPADLPASKTARTMLARLLMKEEPAKAAKFAAPDAQTPNAGPGSLTLYTEALVNANRLDDAERQVSRLLSIAPDDPATLTLRMRLARARGKGGDAAQTLVQSAAERIAQPDGEKAGRLLVQTLLVELDDLAAAETVAKILVEKYPKNASVLAAVLARQGRRDEAIKLYLKAIEIGDPASIREAAQNALAMITRDEYAPETIAMARSVIDAARARDPKNVELLTMAGYLAHYEQRYDDELKIYEDALVSQPDDIQLLNNMAWTLCEGKNQPEKALKMVDEAMRKAGRNLPQFYDTRGVIYTRLGRYNEAIDDLRLAVLERPTGVVWAHLARAYQKAGMTEEFEKAREKAKTAKPPLKPEAIEKGERDELVALIFGKG